MGIQHGCGNQMLKYSKVWRMDSWWGPGRCVHLCVYVFEMGRGRAQVTDVLSKVEICCTFLNFLPLSLVIIIFVFPLESPWEIQIFCHGGLHLTRTIRAESAAVGQPDGSIFKHLPEHFKLQPELRITGLTST